MSRIRNSDYVDRRPDSRRGQPDAASAAVTDQTHYRLAASKQTFAASSKIRFITKARLSALLDDAGLTVERWLGDWGGSEHLAKSHEVIALGRLR